MKQNFWLASMISTMSAHTMRRLVILLMLQCFGFGDPLCAFADDPAALLCRAKAAAGGDAWDSARTSHTRAQIETGGLKGTAEDWSDVLTGRGRSQYSIGPATGAEGWDGKAGWSQDSSGQSKKMQGGDEVEGAVDDLYRRCLAYWYTNRWPAIIEDAGSESQGERQFRVLRITPQGGRPFDLWLDTATWLIDRTVEKAAIETRTVFFSEYRDQGGKKIAFAMRSTNGEKRYDQLITVQSVEFNIPVQDEKFRMPGPPAPDFTFAAGKTSTTVPFELINNHIYVKVKLNGQGPFTVLCDTGGENVITPTVSGRLGVKGEGALQGRGVGEKSEDIALVKLQTLTLGDVTVSNQLFAVFALEPFADIEGIAQSGLIGYEVFKRFVVKVDYERSQLTVSLPSAFKYEGGGTAVPFRFNDRIPQVDGGIDGIAGKFDIDTGSRSSVSVPKPFAEKNDLRARLAPRFEAVTGWGIGGPARGLVARAHELRLGDVVVPSPLTEISLQQKGALVSPYIAGNVGAGVLKRFNVTFDYGQQRMFFETNANTASADVYDRSGMWLNRAGTALKVFDVTIGGPAESAGLKVDDRIVAVDGAPISDRSLITLRKRFRTEPPGTTIRLSVESNNGKREVNLVLKELL
jgi:hypothetical protein